MAFIGPHIINVDLMSQREERGSDLISGFSVIIIYVITVAPGEYSLLDVKLHCIISPLRNMISYRAVLCKENGAAKVCAKAGITKKLQMRRRKKGKSGVLSGMGSGFM
jgi:hypothetical protein